MFLTLLPVLEQEADSRYKKEISLTFNGKVVFQISATAFAITEALPDSLCTLYPFFLLLADNVCSS